MKTLTAYAMQFVGIPYIWGGNDPIIGYDCSGFIQELLSSVGADPPGDQTAQSLYNHFCRPENGEITESQPGSLIFYGRSDNHITHVTMCIERGLMIEAGGGGRRCKTREDAAYHNAHVRVRPISQRSDLVAIIMPWYNYS